MLARHKQISSMLLVLGLFLSSNAFGKRRHLHRNVDFKKAYFTKTDTLGKHISIKISFPETHGKPGLMLLEIYNHSGQFLSVIDFHLELLNKFGDQIEVNADTHGLKPGRSNKKWMKMPKGPFPEITGVKILKMKTLGQKGPVLLNVNTDLIQ